MNKQDSKNMFLRNFDFMVSSPVLIFKPKSSSTDSLNQILPDIFQIAMRANEPKKL